MTDTSISSCDIYSNSPKRMNFDAVVQRIVSKSVSHVRGSRLVRPIFYIQWWLTASFSFRLSDINILRFELVLIHFPQCLSWNDIWRYVIWWVWNNTIRDVVRIVLLFQGNEWSDTFLCVRMVDGTKHEQIIFGDNILYWSTCCLALYPFLFSATSAFDVDCCTK